MTVHIRTSREASGSPWAVEVVAAFATLVAAWRTGDKEKAQRFVEHLQRHGVVVTIVAREGGDE